MKKTIFFNHKGGVGKTSTIIEVSKILTSKGHKVLMVDADPQCSLSISVLGLDSYKKMLLSNPKENIYGYLENTFESRPVPIQCGYCRETSENTYLLMGSLDFSLYEPAVSLALSFPTFTVFQNLVGSFNELIEKTAKMYDVDHVLIDVNPSLSATNKCLLFSSDCLVIPVFGDFLSTLSLNSLGKTLKNWDGYFGREDNKQFLGSFYPMSKKQPKILGVNVGKVFEDDKTMRVFYDSMKNSGYGLDPVYDGFVTFDYEKLTDKIINS